MSSTQNSITHVHTLIKVKLFLKEAMVAHSVVRRRGSHIFYTIDSQMAVRLSALRPGRPLPPGGFLVLISVRG
jgi:predicted RNA binding protein YcfA (HicA-like mRNA interferase family)